MRAIFASSTALLAALLVPTSLCALSFSSQAAMDQLAIRNFHESENPNLHFDAAFEYDGAIQDLRMGDFKKAASRLENILEYYPDEPTILTAYGVALEGAGDWARAEKTFARALRYKKDKVLARAEHGVALAKLGRTVQAKAELALLQTQAEQCGLCAESGNIHDGVEEIEAALNIQGVEPASPHP